MNQIVRNADASTVATRLASAGFWPAAGTCIVEQEGTTVVYGGHGGHSGALYKFVVREPSDEGVLYVAHFEADAEEDGFPVAFGDAPLALENGRVAWKPVVFGTGPLTPANGFADQTDVLADKPRAAALLRATRVDLLQETVADLDVGTVRCVLADHVIEIAEAGGDFTALKGHWDVLFTRDGL